MHQGYRASDMHTQSSRSRRSQKSVSVSVSHSAAASESLLLLLLFVRGVAVLIRRVFLVLGLRITGWGLSLILCARGHVDRIGTFHLPEQLSSETALLAWARNIARGARRDRRARQGLREEVRGRRHSLRSAGDGLCGGGDTALVARARGGLDAAPAEAREEALGVG